MSEHSRDDVKRDPALAAIYRAAADELPPPSVDATILAAAHREVGAKPRAAGRAFARPWRGALSVAAVLVLSVSLVVLMREEAPDVLSPHGSDGALDADAKLQSDMANKNREKAAGAPDADQQTPKSIGLKSSGDMPSSGLGMRQPSTSGLVQPTAKDTGNAKLEAPPAAVAGLAKRRESYSESNEARSDRALPEVRQERPVAKQDSNREFAQAPPARPAAEPPAERQAASNAIGRVLESESAPKVAAAAGQREEDAAGRGQSRDNRARATADSLSAAAPAAAPAATPETKAMRAPAQPEAAKPATPMASPPPAPQVKPEAKPAFTPAPAPQKTLRDADLPPEKWLERIEDLRKQGRLDEARASLTEFRKRYPDYRLPESLRDGIR